MNLQALLLSALAERPDHELADAMRGLPDIELAAIARNGAGATLLRHAAAEPEEEEPKPKRKPKAKARGGGEEEEGGTRGLVLAAVNEAGKEGIRLSEVTEQLGVHQATVSNHLKALLRAGKVSQAGRARASRWYPA